jgi:hypothetical protein
MITEIDRLIEGATYTGEFNAAVAAFGGCASLLDVQKSELAAGGLDHAHIVGGGVVPAREILVSLSTLSHQFNHEGFGSHSSRIRARRDVRVAATVLESDACHCDGVGFARRLMEGRSMVVIVRFEVRSKNCRRSSLPSCVPRIPDTSLDIVSSAGPHLRAKVLDAKVTSGGGSAISKTSLHTFSILVPVWWKVVQHCYRPSLLSWPKQRAGSASSMVSVLSPKSPK